ncbi:MAG: hypothetical protein V7K97_08990 [Nostoc sp.]|uniref:hypothetical protein n=1 Tax=Nostoc sp. TaxID=1180 RepID=UPI002FF50380
MPFYFCLLVLGAARTSLRDAARTAALSDRRRHRSPHSSDRPLPFLEEKKAIALIC